MRSFVFRERGCSTLRIGTKMIVGYILLIIIPFLFFAIFVYAQLNEKLTTQYQLANQQNIEQLAVNLDASFLKIESLYSIYQNNSALIDYLRGNELNDRDLIYSYLKDISPALSFASLAEAQVDNLTVYPKTQRKMLTVSGFKPYEEGRKELTDAELSALSPKSGLWKRAETGGTLSLVFYHKIYNDLYSNDLGILAISVHSSLVEDFVQSLRSMHSGNTVLLTDANGQTIYRSIDNENNFKTLDDAARRVHAGEKEHVNARFIVNSAPIKQLGWTVIEINPRESLVHLIRVKQWWLLGGVGLLLLLSTLYYAILSSLTKRMLLLSRHMRRVGPDWLGHSYTGPVGKDEFGYLISNYNAMIARIDELVNRVQKVEILKKDAEFKMLQAQIQPHFLYNTLETMRMLARANDDSTVSEMAYSLGSLMRYSLSRKDNTTIGEEWEYLRQYLAIHKIRMPDLQIEWEKDEAATSIPCPRFILQPLVENSILHGFSKRRGGKLVSIRMAVQGEFVIIIVADNGTGVSDDRMRLLQQKLRDNNGYDEGGISETEGIGLSNVLQRVKAYFGPQSSLALESKLGEGTVCTLKLYLEERDHAKLDDH